MEPSERIDELIAGLDDWRGPALARLRALIHEADPEVTEDWKYMGSPCWYHDGMLAVGNAFKTSVKMGFLYGASLPDPAGVFNDELGGNQRRALKLSEGDSYDEAAFRRIVQEAVARNRAAVAARKK